jgi:hypothetical protein
MDQNLIELCERQFVKHVEELFKWNRTGSYVFDDAIWAHDPIWNSIYCLDDEASMAAIKRRTLRALAAREWFKHTGPSWAQPLPLAYDEIDKLLLIDDSRMELLHYYVNSLMHADMDYRTHPGFTDYCCGLMAADDAPEHWREDPDLLREFPPKPLAGIGKGLAWYSTAMLAEMAEEEELWRRSRAAAAMVPPG